jgi:hypothetical protein
LSKRTEVKKSIKFNGSMDDLRRLVTRATIRTEGYKVICSDGGMVELVPSTGTLFFGGPKRARILLERYFEENVK